MEVRRKKHKSPYLASTHRLADVIAAIQVMGTYKFYKLTIDKWAERISGLRQDSEYWHSVFTEHPEFFLLEEENRSALVWRRTNQKLYNVDKESNITREEYNRLNEEKRARISRKPLTPEDIHTLINTAIELHSRALAQKREERWWIPIVAALIGVLVGALAKGS